MKTFVLAAFAALAVFLFLTALFFFVLTRGALLLRSLSPKPDAASHVYPIYSNMRLIKLVDYQPVISAILLFQYHRLVSRMVTDLQRKNLAGKKMLITSCAFGNVIPRVVEAAVQSGAQEILISDIVHNELLNAQSKLQPFASSIRYLSDDATAMQQPDASVDVNVLFFRNRTWICIEVMECSPTGNGPLIGRRISVEVKKSQCACSTVSLVSCSRLRRYYCSP